MGMVKSMRSKAGLPYGVIRESPMAGRERADERW